MNVRGQEPKLLEMEGLFLIANYQEMYEEFIKDSVNHDLEIPIIPQDILLIPCKLSNSLSIKDVIESCNIAYLVYAQAARWTQPNLEEMFKSANPLLVEYKGITGSALNPFAGRVTQGKLLKGRLFFDVSKNQYMDNTDDKTKYQLSVIFEGLEKKIFYLDNPNDFGYLKKIEIAH